ncbi:MAG: hypothetical protein LBI33_06150 [Propionibacteriaceae bacterium]|jgi:hypothetical protein|nr:hypothetical protein [Propionibacteriaceae bacterium]
MTGPLAQVRAACAAGARTVPQIARATGLNRDVVQGAVDHLVARGGVAALPLTTGCPPGACDGCALWSRFCRPRRLQLRA